MVAVVVDLYNPSGQPDFSQFFLMTSLSPNEGSPNGSSPIGGSPSPNGLSPIGGSPIKVSLNGGGPPGRKLSTLNFCIEQQPNHIVIIIPQ